MLRQEHPDRRLVDHDGRFIPRRHDDGRGAYGDHLGFAAPVDFRFYLRLAAETAGTTVAAFLRDAAEKRAAQILTNREAA